MRERCGIKNCGICESNGDYRAMRWTPLPVMTHYNRAEQKRGRSWWYTDKQTLEEATAWAGP